MHPSGLILNVLALVPAATTTAKCYTCPESGAEFDGSTESLWWIYAATAVQFYAVFSTGTEKTTETDNDWSCYCVGIGGTCYSGCVHSDCDLSSVCFTGSANRYAGSDRDAAGSTDTSTDGDAHNCADAAVV